MDIDKYLRKFYVCAVRFGCLTRKPHMNDQEVQFWPVSRTPRHKHATGKLSEHILNLNSGKGAYAYAQVELHAVVMEKFHGNRCNLVKLSIKGLKGQSSPYQPSRSTLMTRKQRTRWILISIYVNFTFAPLGLGVWLGNPAHEWSGSVILTSFSHATSQAHHGQAIWAYSKSQLK